MKGHVPHITRLPGAMRACLAQGGRLLLFASALASSVAASAQATDLIISQYLEGNSGNNKYIELYNGTSGAINLADYQLHLYVNGSPTATQATLTGSLPAGGTIVYGNSGGTIYTPFTALNSICSFNGDDAIALYKISTSSFVDIFGIIGNDPGTAWTSGSLSTANQSLVRNPNICAGVTVNPTGTFTTLGSQWTNAGTDDVSDLGTHTMTCGPTVNFSTATSSALENAGSAMVTLNISPAATGAGTITIAIGGGTATYGAGNDYTTSPTGPATFNVTVPNGATSVNFTINIVDDAVTEADETIDFTITGATGGIVLGANLNHVFTILNDDTTPTINFSTLSISVLENVVGAQTFSLNRSPVSASTLDVTITISTSTATYGVLPNDYTTNAFSGDGSSGTFTVRFFPNQPTATFTATVNDDAIPEPTEHVIFTITAVPAGCAIGSNNTATLIIGDNDSPPTVLAPGDLAIVGVNANNNDCDGGTAGDDYVSFFCFQEITYGTEIILTDNGYERCNPGQWGNVEGTVRMKRTGPAIPAGQVVTFRIKGSGTPNVISVAPDAGWSCTSIGIGGTTLALNLGGDQLFFLQGGTWNAGTASANNATYSGTLLYAFSTNPSPPWTASCGTNPNQRSNLPPGVECFSMAPTLASDFNKYTGPTTAADQRDWIIRIDNIANWSSYPSCGLYNSLGYNWLTAPILPIIPGSMTHGLWRGAKNTDWFECKNWDDARIPDVATDVVIDSRSEKACYVGMATGLNPGGTATCNSLTQYFTGADAVRALQVHPNSTLTVGGLFKVDNSTTAATITDAVQNDATLNAGAVELSGNAPGTNTTVLNGNSPNARLNITGNLTIGSGARLGLQPAIGNTAYLYLGGDFINLEDEAHFQDVRSVVELNGSGDQQVLNNNPVENFDVLRLNKPSGDVYLTAPIAIRATLDLSQGRLFSTATALPTLNSGATAINASDASFVHGPIKRIGNTDFTFPIGKGNSYRPCGLQAISSGTTTSFTAEYFALDPEVAIGPLSTPTTLHHISHCEYWTIDRNVGGNAKVELSWDSPESCGVTTGALGDLRVAHWNGTNWDDRGNGGTTGNATSGTVITPALESTFSPWTLASVTQNNPLPIELLSFTAVPAGTQVDLAWSTASEKDNDHFTVERSADAATFEPLLTVPGAGNSQGVINYADIDPAPLGGLSYYRLRQTDFNGTSTLSQVVPVFFDGPAKQPLTVLHGPDGAFLLHDFAPGSTLEMLDLTGRTVARSGITEPGLAKLPLDGMAHGAYVLRVSNAERTESTKFVW